MTIPARIERGHLEMIIRRAGLKGTIEDIQRNHPAKPTKAQVEQALWAWLGFHLEAMLLELHKIAVTAGAGKEQFDRYLEEAMATTPEQRRRQYKRAQQGMDELWPEKIRD